MIQKPRRRSRYGLVWAFFALGLCVMFSASRSATHQAQTATESLIVPMTSTVDAIGYWFSARWASLASIGTLRKEYQELQAYTQLLEQELARVEAITEENHALREQVGLAAQRGFPTAVVEVIGRDAVAGAQFITINKGRAHGVVEGATVITQGTALVGRVIAVEEHAARVELITHAGHKFNVVVAGQTEGVAVGQYGTTLHLEGAAQTAQITPGDTVTTSYIGDDFLPGLAVGVVQNVDFSEDGLFATATITTYAALGTMRFAEVIVR